MQIYNISHRRLSLTGQVYIEKRRLVVRRHSVGDPNVLQPPAVGRADQRAGGRKR